MSDPIREVYKRYRNKGGGLRDYHSIICGGPEYSQDFIDDAWLAIRAHIEQQDAQEQPCVWTRISNNSAHMTAAPLVSGCKVEFASDADMEVWEYCPYCGHRIERKETP